MSDGIYMIFAGVLIIAGWGLFVSIREDRQDAKELKKKEDKLEMIEQALKIWAQNDKNCAAALKKVGLL